MLDSPASLMQFTQFKFWELEELGGAGAVGIRCLLMTFCALKFVKFVCIGGSLGAEFFIVFDFSSEGDVSRCVESRNLFVFCMSVLGVLVIKTRIVTFQDAISTVKQKAATCLA